MSVFWAGSVTQGSLYTCSHASPGSASLTPLPNTQVQSLLPLSLVSTLTPLTVTHYPLLVHPQLHSTLHPAPFRCSLYSHLHSPIGSFTLFLTLFSPGTNCPTPSPILSSRLPCSFACHGCRLGGRSGGDVRRGSRVGVPFRMALLHGTTPPPYEPSESIGI